MSVASVQEIFEKELPARLEKNSEVLQKINAIYKLVITGNDGGTWMIDLTKPGGSIHVGDGEAKCTMTLTSQDFVALMNRTLNPQMAFMGGKLKVTGDMSLALKLGALFS